MGLTLAHKRTYADRRGEQTPERLRGAPAPGDDSGGVTACRRDPNARGCLAVQVLVAAPSCAAEDGALMADEFGGMSPPPTNKMPMKYKVGRTKTLAELIDSELPGVHVGNEDVKTFLMQYILDVQSGTHSADGKTSRKVLESLKVLATIVMNEDDVDGDSELAAVLAAARAAGGDE